MSTLTKKRNSNIELLRIVAMLMVISIHFWGKCIMPSNENLYEPANLFGWFIRGFSYMGVNIFIITSAFFQCTKKQFNLQGVVKLILEVWFYSVLIFLTLHACGVAFSSGEILSAFTPILSGEYWFITVYVGLYLLTPFLNKLIRSLSKNEMKLLLAILLIFFSVIPNIYPSSKWLNFGSGYGIVWFIVLYFIGAYLRLHVNFDQLYAKYKTRQLLAIMLLFWCLPIISKIAIAITTQILTGEIIASSACYFKNSVILVPASIVTFVAFNSIRISNQTTSHIINSLATGAFAVYLIHDNPLLSPILWGGVGKFITSELVSIPIWALSVIVIYATCCLIDVVRRKFFNLLGRLSIIEGCHKKIERVNEKIKPYIPQE